MINSRDITRSSVHLNDDLLKQKNDIHEKALFNEGKTDEFDSKVTKKKETQCENEEKGFFSNFFCLLF